MKNKLLAELFTGLFLLGFIITHVNAATFSFNGTVTNILIDNGSGTYSGIKVGDLFSGNFSYGDSANEAIDISTESNERNWEFQGSSFGASIINGEISIDFSSTRINIQNNWPLDAGSVDFLNTLFEQNVSIGGFIDTWSSGGTTEGAFWIDAPTFGDPDNENLANGMIIEVAFISYDSTLYSGLDYQPLFPSTEGLAFFLIEEADKDGNKLFSAVGLIDTKSICNEVPGKIQLTSPSGITENTTPVFRWEEDACATWYKIYISNTSANYKFVQWYEIKDNFLASQEVNCSDGECTVLLNSELKTGNYDWWVRGWNENGNGLWSDGLNFTITGDENLPSKVTHISPSGQITDSTPAFTWNHDPASTWYKLWVGYSNGNRVFTQWYDTSQLCSGGSCPVTLETELMDGNYEWYVKSWNDYGNVWSDGMAFSIVTPKTYYRDNDQDGCGDPTNSRIDTIQPTGYVQNKTDCDDANSSIHPGATEICGDGIDQDCNGSDKACENSSIVGTWHLSTVNGQQLYPGVFLTWSVTANTVTITSDLDCIEVIAYNVSGGTLTGSSLISRTGTQCDDDDDEDDEGLVGQYSVEGNTLTVWPVLEGYSTPPIFVFKKK